MPWHIRATPNDIADTVFVVGDPGRAKKIASKMNNIKLVNDYRSLLVYTGYVGDNRFTIATHGMGAGSAAIVFEELIKLGAKRLIRLGTAGGIPGKVETGDVVIADSAGTVQGGCALAQYAPGLIPPLAPDLTLTTKIIKILNNNNIKYKTGAVFCSDAFYAEDENLSKILSKTGFVAIDMETAILFYISRIRGIKSSSLLLVTNVVGEHFPPQWDPDERLGMIFSMIAYGLS